MGGNNGDSSVSSKLKMVVKKYILLPCTSLCTNPVNSSSDYGQESESGSSPRLSLTYGGEIGEEGDFVANVSSKNLCTICLEPLLTRNPTSNPGKAVFTSQCSHSFHLSCISSNIRHGSVSCPICRAQWTRLPRILHPPCHPLHNQQDPIIRILDDSISTFRVHRRSFVRTARYNDDDPIEPESHPPCGPRLCFNLTPLEITQTPSRSPSPWYNHKRPMYLSVRLAPQQAIDLVLVASPNGPHLRLLKQSMALVVYSLRAIDRLAIVSYSSSAARIFPLRRMTSYGKRAALQVIDRLFYSGHGDPQEGIKKGIKILEDRTHENPYTSILHLSDYPTPCQPYCTSFISIYQFHVGSTGSIMHELETLLGELLRGVVHEVQLRIGDNEDSRIVRLGEIRGGEERRVILEADESRGNLSVGYSYVEGGFGEGENIRVGELVVGFGDRRGGGNANGNDEECMVSNGGRNSCVDSWDYHDPYMSRRWAKRLDNGRHRI